MYKCLWFEIKDCLPRVYLDKHDVLNLPKGYSYQSKTRLKCKKKSVGIVVIFRESLKNSISFYDTKSEFVQWFVIKAIRLGLDKNLLVRGVYIPPENSITLLMSLF